MGNDRLVWILHSRFQIGENHSKKVEENIQGIEWVRVLVKTPPPSKFRKFSSFDFQEKNVFAASLKNLPNWLSSVTTINPDIVNIFIKRKKVLEHQEEKIEQIPKKAKKIKQDAIRVKFQKAALFQKPYLDFTRIFTQPSSMLV